jgi:hypothetical protein
MIVGSKSQKREFKRQKENPSHETRSQLITVQLTFTRIPEFRKTVCAFIVSWNARVLSHEMQVCRTFSLVSNFHYNSCQDGENCIRSCSPISSHKPTTHAHFTQQRTRIPCKPRQFRGMRVCANCDREPPLKIGEVFFLPLLLYSMTVDIRQLRLPSSENPRRPRNHW